MKKKGFANIFLHWSLIYFTKWIMIFIRVGVPLIFFTYCFVCLPAEFGYGRQLLLSIKMFYLFCHKLSSCTVLLTNMIWILQIKTSLQNTYVCIHLLESLLLFISMSLDMHFESLFMCIHAWSQDYRCCFLS